MFGRSWLARGGGLRRPITTAPSPPTAIAAAAAVADGHAPKASLLPFRPLLLTQFGGLLDAVNAAQSPTSALSPSAPLSPQFQPPYFVSPKHDGVRCVSWQSSPPSSSSNPSPSSPRQSAAQKKASSSSSSHPSPASSSSCYTRFGTVLPPFPLIEAELALLRRLCGDDGLCLDGELYLHDDQALQRRRPMTAAAERTMRGGEAAVGAGMISGGGGVGIAAHGEGYRRMKEVLGRMQFGATAAEALGGGGGGGGGDDSVRLNPPAAAIVSPSSSSSSSSSLPPPLVSRLPHHPRFCVFDVVSYTPPQAPTSPLMAHVLAATGITRLSSVGSAPNATPFILRMRTMVFLFTLLQTYTILVEAAAAAATAPQTASSTGAGKKKETKGGGSAPSSSSPSEAEVMAYPAPIIAQLLKTYSSRGISGGVHGKTANANATSSNPSSHIASSASSSALPLLLNHHPLAYRGGHFVKMVPYSVLGSLEDAPVAALPGYLAQGYEGAVVRTALNMYSIAGGYSLPQPTKGNNGGDGADESGVDENCGRDAAAAAAAAAGGRGRNLASRLAVAVSASAAPHPHQQHRSSRSSDTRASTPSPSTPPSSLLLANTPRPSVRSPTAVKLLPYFDTEFMVLDFAGEEEEVGSGGVQKQKGNNKNAPRRKIEGRQSASSPSSPSPRRLLTSLLCCTDRGTPFTVSALNLGVEQRRQLYASLMDASGGGGGGGGSSSSSSEGNGEEGAGGIGAYVTLQYASMGAPSSSSPLLPSSSNAKEGGGRGGSFSPSKKNTKKGAARAPLSSSITSTTPDRRRTLFLGGSGGEKVPINAVIKGVRGPTKGRFM